jgi:hypothetical protein
VTADDFRKIARVAKTASAWLGAQEDAYRELSHYMAAIGSRVRAEREGRELPPPSWEVERHALVAGLNHEP